MRVKEGINHAPVVKERGAHGIAPREAEHREEYDEKRDQQGGIGAVRADAVVEIDAGGDQNATFGTSFSASSTARYSRGPKLPTPATIDHGKDWRRVS